MTDTDIIQRARDVLAKYRSYAPTAQEWGLRGGTSRLIRIATDPDLLDAIDGLLASAQSIAASTPGMIRFLERAERIAAAIIAAEERMNA